MQKSEVQELRKPTLVEIFSQLLHISFKHLPENADNYSLSNVGKLTNNGKVSIVNIEKEIGVL